MIRILSGSPHPLCPGEQTPGRWSDLLRGCPHGFGAKLFIDPGKPASELLVEESDELPVRPGLRPDPLQVEPRLLLRAREEVQETQRDGGGPRDALPAVERVPGGFRGSQAEELDDALDVPGLGYPLDCLRPELLDFLRVIEPQLEYRAEVVLDDCRNGFIRVPDRDAMAVVRAPARQVLHQLLLTEHLYGNRVHGS